MQMTNCRILFMGTPSISAKVLNGLIENGFNIVGVIAQPDRPVGRKKILQPVPTKVVAQAHNIPVFQPVKIRKEFEFVNELKPDIIVTLAYGQIVPQELLDIPPLGAVNLHGSLLPKYRGAAPIQYALLNNEKETGMTLMRMVKAMDAGEMFDIEKVTISEDDNSTSLFEKMGDAALKLILRDLPLLISKKLVGKEQDESLVTFAPSIKPEEERINLSDSKERIFGLIRALSDVPGAYLIFKQQKIKIFKAKIVSDTVSKPIGSIIKADKGGLEIQLNNGVISILELQKEGKNKMDYKSFINGNPSLLGEIFE